MRRDASFRVGRTVPSVANMQVHSQDWHSTPMRRKKSSRKAAKLAKDFPGSPHLEMILALRG